MREKFSESYIMFVKCLIESNIMFINRIKILFKFLPLKQNYNWSIRLFTNNGHKDVQR